MMKGIGLTLLTAVLMGVFMLLSDRVISLKDERDELRTELAACRDTCARYDMSLRIDTTIVRHWPDSGDCLHGRF